MYDFVIIGGGIIGMSTAMQLIEIYPDARIALLEKEAGPACHQTGHNSGVIHAGVYYTPGSLKAQFCLAGNRATKAFCEQNGIRYDVCGKMLVATSPLEMERMRALWDRTAANGPARVAKRRGATRARTEHYRARRDLRPFQRHRQLPRSGGGNGEELRSERRDDRLQRRSQRPERTCLRRGDPHPPGRRV